MYSLECKKCVVAGCPDDCSIKRKYFEDFVHITRCESCKYCLQYIVNDHWRYLCSKDSDGLRYVSEDGYCEKGALE